MLSSSSFHPYTKWQGNLPTWNLLRKINRQIENKSYTHLIGFDGEKQRDSDDVKIISQL